MSTECRGEDVANFDIEEAAYVILHNLVDDIFDNLKRSDDCETINLIQGYSDDELPPIPSSPPLLPKPIALGTRNPPQLMSLPSNKRKRLGGNPRAHEKIVGLQSTLEYVCEERDFWRQKCYELEAKRKDAHDRNLLLEEKLAEFVTPNQKWIKSTSKRAKEIGHNCLQGQNEQ